MSPWLATMLPGGGAAVADSVTTPLVRTVTAADLVFQRNSTEILRLTSTGPAVPLGKSLDVFNVGAAGDANYEKMSLAWFSNVGYLYASKGGTGVNRALYVLHGDLTGLKIVGSGQVAIVGSAGGVGGYTVESDAIGTYLYGKITTSTANASVAISNAASAAGFSAASGTQKVCSVSGTTGQSGTAAFIGLESDVTPTAVGSGTVYGLSVKRAGVQVFGVDVKATLTADASTVMWLTYFSGGAVKHAAVTLGADVAGQRYLQVAT